MLFQTSKLGGSRGNGGDAEGEDAQSLKKDDTGVWSLGFENEAGLLEPEIAAIL